MTSIDIELGDGAALDGQGRNLFELAFAGMIIVVLSPILLAIMACIWLEDGGPPMFAHSRIGRDGRSFDCLKFRSMRVDASHHLTQHLLLDEAARREWELTHKLRADPRITTTGAFLRKTSLDELPQLLNVVRGEMSLVGPRPIVQAEVARYGRYFDVYCSLRPGITGLWQVSGRSAVSYRRRVAMDVLYARSRCTALYMKVLVMTVPAVLRRRGAY